MRRKPRGYAAVDNSAVAHCYYLRTCAPLPIAAEALGRCGEGTAYVTAPMSVREMHDLAASLRAQDPQVFFAGIRD